MSGMAATKHDRLLPLSCWRIEYLFAQWQFTASFGVVIETKIIDPYRLKRVLTTQVNRCLYAMEGGRIIYTFVFTNKLTQHLLFFYHDWLAFAIKLNFLFFSAFLTFLWLLYCIVVEFCSALSPVFLQLTISIVIHHLTDSCCPLSRKGNWRSYALTVEYHILLMCILKPTLRVQPFNQIGIPVP